MNARTNCKQTSLHIAATKDHSVICTILLENGVEFDTLDENGDNGSDKNFLDSLYLFFLLVFKVIAHFKTFVQEIGKSCNLFQPYIYNTKAIYLSIIQLPALQT